MKLKNEDTKVEDLIPIFGLRVHSLQHEEHTVCLLLTRDEGRGYV